MDLILWRHAEAEEGEPDLARELTPKGEKQAQRIAQWLLQRLPGKFILLSSPAARAQQTAEALGVPVKTVKDIAPGAAVSAILKAANWPEQKGAPPGRRAPGEGGEGPRPAGLVFRRPKGGPPARRKGPRWGGRTPPPRAPFCS